MVVGEDGQHEGTNQDVVPDEISLGARQGGRTGRAGPAAGAVQRRGLAAPSAGQSRGKPASTAGWRLSRPGRAVRGSRRVGLSLKTEAKAEIRPCFVTSQDKAPPGQASPPAAARPILLRGRIRTIVLQGFRGRPPLRPSDTEHGVQHHGSNATSGGWGGISAPHEGLPKFGDTPGNDVASRDIVFRLHPGADHSSHGETNGPAERHDGVRAILHIPPESTSRDAACFPGAGEPASRRGT